jgi:molybdopterin-guanine dinucleotide biosynthesis protein A
VTFGRREPIGVILAGGLGRRIGGAKAVVELAGHPLISYPLAALRGALRDVAIVAKPDTQLPSLPGVTVWIEPATPRHPLVGLTEALGLAGGRPVIVCAADLPFVTAELVKALAATDPAGAPAVLAASRGEIQPLLGCYQPGAADLLGRADAGERRPMLEILAAIRPRVLEVEDPDVLFNVNAPEDLLRAAAMLDARRLHPAPGRRGRTH